MPMTKLQWLLYIFVLNILHLKLLPARWQYQLVTTQLHVLQGISQPIEQKSAKCQRIFPIFKIS